MTQTYKAPDVPTEQVTPEFVRDQLLTCFESANKEFVESVFVNCGASYTDPTRDGILTAMNQCRTNAEKMMGPQGADIIQHHYDEMMKLVDRLPERPVYAATSRLV